jgi:hypothetical protein
MRIGFSPFTYNIDEEDSSISVCAAVSDISQSAPTTIIKMETRSLNCGEI